MICIVEIVRHMKKELKSTIWTLRFLLFFVTEKATFFQANFAAML